MKKRIKDRFVRKYNNLTEEDKTLADAIKAKAEELEALYEQIDENKLRRDGVDKALDHLETSVMWAVKAVFN